MAAGMVRTFCAALRHVVEVVFLVFVAWARLAISSDLFIASVELVLKSFHPRVVTFPTVVVVSGMVASLGPFRLD